MAPNNIDRVVEVDEEGFSHGNMMQSFSSSPPRAEQWEVDHGNIENSLTLGERLGCKAFITLKVYRAAVAEVFGTAVLVFMIGVIVISSFESETKTPNVLMSILIAITMSILILVVSPISGGHMNPAISFSATLFGLISLSRAFIYIIAQCLGGLLGALALKVVVSQSIAHKYSLGGCTLTIAPGSNEPTNVGIETSQALWLEIICTFVFLFASIWLAYDQRRLKDLGHVLVFSIIGIVLGVLVFISTIVTGKIGYAGVGMNPARCLGPALISGGHLWDGHWVFWVGPAIACIGFYFYKKIIPTN